jgi:trimeric autotransporter adhesin
MASNYNYRCFLITCFFSFTTVWALAQVGIGTNTPSAGAALDINFSNRGLLIPRVNLSSITDNTTIPQPAVSLLVYNTNASITNGGGTGFYYNAGTQGAPQWTRIQNAAGAGQPWLITGNAGTDPAVNFVGPTNNVPLVFKTNNIQSGILDPNMNSYFIGENAGVNNIALNNVGIGHNAMRNNTLRGGLVAIGDSVLYTNGVGGASSTAGAFNTGVGSRALRSNTTGANNTAIGTRALLQNTTGSHNTAAGFDALRNNVGASFNSALGSNALAANTSGANNTAMGYLALRVNTTASNNTAIGANSLGNNVTGARNTAVGFGALFQNTGSDNTFVGFNAGGASNTGSSNTAVGAEALEGTSPGAGGGNVAVGYRTLRVKGGGASNTAIGYEALRQTTGDANTAIGHNAGLNLAAANNNTIVGAAISFSSPTITNSTAIGYGVSITASNQVRIGNASVNSIGGQADWTALSDERAKSDIKANVPGLDFIMKLRPVSYFLHENFESATAAENMTMVNKSLPRPIRRVGFLAQEVEAAALNIGYEFDGVDKPENPDGAYGLRYGLFVVPLIKAVQEQQNQIDVLLQKANALKLQLEEELKRRAER